MKNTIPKLEDLNITGKTVLLRVDLNVPMVNGKISDITRVTRLIPTLNYLIQKKAKIVILSHFGRPGGEFKKEMSLAPLVSILSDVLDGIKVHFSSIDKEKVTHLLKEGEILLLENLRFYKGEEENDLGFTNQLAKLGDYYVNDAFSSSHRKHSSIVGLPKILPSAAGILLQNEIKNLEGALKYSNRPVVAIVGGAKISTKLNILNNLVKKVDLLVIGGAMANSFLHAKGNKIGKSFYEPNLRRNVLQIIESAKNCELFIPNDVVVVKELTAHSECKIVSVSEVVEDDIIVDIGPNSISSLQNKLESISTLIWNGPLGVFEKPPFGTATITLARTVASLTNSKKLISICGGGDIISALNYAGLQKSFSYISTAGGAFLEWLEGRELPGVTALKMK